MLKKLRKLCICISIDYVNGYGNNGVSSRKGE